MFLLSMQKKDDLILFLYIYQTMFLLSMQPNLASVVEPDTYMTPLHVCCLGLQPPPIWITRGLLYSDNESCRRRDSGGRLPLHLLAATSADPATMQLLVEENPASVTKRDQRGFTPLQLLLKNDRITLRLEHMRILLGQHLQTTITEESDNMKGQTQHLSLRKRQHLNQTVQDLEERRRRQLEKEQRHEESFVDYPEDVLMGLNNITQWADYAHDQTCFLQDFLDDGGVPRTLAYLESYMDNADSVTAVANTICQIADIGPDNAKLNIDNQNSKVKSNIEHRTSNNRTSEIEHRTLKIKHRNAKNGCSAAFFDILIFCFSRNLSRRPPRRPPQGHPGHPPGHPTPLRNIPTAAVSRHFAQCDVYRVTSNL